MCVFVRLDACIVSGVCVVVVVFGGAFDRLWSNGPGLVLVSTARCRFVVSLDRHSLSRAIYRTPLCPLVPHHMHNPCPLSASTHVARRHRGSPYFGTGVCAHFYRTNSQCVSPGRLGVFERYMPSVHHRLVLLESSRACVVSRNMVQMFHGPLVYIYSTLDSTPRNRTRTTRL